MIDLKTIFQSDLGVQSYKVEWSREGGFALAANIMIKKQNLWGFQDASNESGKGSIDGKLDGVRGERYYVVFHCDFGDVMLIPSVRVLKASFYWSDEKTATKLNRPRN